MRLTLGEETKKKYAVGVAILWKDGTWVEDTYHIETFGNASTAEREAVNRAAHVSDIGLAVLTSINSEE